MAIDDPIDHLIDTALNPSTKQTIPTPTVVQMAEDYIHVRQMLTDHGIIPETDFGDVALSIVNDAYRYAQMRKRPKVSIHNYGGPK